MAQQSTSLAMSVSITQTKYSKWRKAHRFIDGSLHEVGLLTIYLLDAFGVGKRNLIGTDADDWTVFFMQSVNCASTMTAKIDKCQPS